MIFNYNVRVTWSSSVILPTCYQLTAYRTATVKRLSFGEKNMEPKMCRKPELHTVQFPSTLFKSKGIRLGVDKLFIVVRDDTDALVSFGIGGCWVHHWCAVWSEGVKQTEDEELGNVDKAIISGTQRVSTVSP